jgi:hypothetical protein
MVGCAEKHAMRPAVWPSMRGNRDSCQPNQNCLVNLSFAVAPRAHRKRRRLATAKLEEDPARRGRAQAQAVVALVSLTSPRFTEVYPTSLGVLADWTYEPPVATRRLTCRGPVRGAHERSGRTRCRARCSRSMDGLADSSSTVKAWSCSEADPWPSSLRLGTCSPFFYGERNGQKVVTRIGQAQQAEPLRSAATVLPTTR